MVEIRSFIKLMLVEHLLYAFPDFSFSQLPLCPLPTPHSPKEEQNRAGRGRAPFGATSERTPWCAFATGGRLVMSSLRRHHSMVKQGQTDTCEGQTDGSGAVVAAAGEAGVERASGQSGMSWLPQVEAGFKVTLPLCTPGCWGPETDFLTCPFLSPTCRLPSPRLSLV